MDPKTREKLERITESALQSVGFELVELEYKRESQGWVLRVFIDHPSQGAVERGVSPKRISLEDCTKATRQISAAMDVEDPISSAYRLEVSSPGLLRPLRKSKDFERFIGWRAKVKLSEDLSGRKNFTGVIETIKSAMLVLRVDEECFELPLDKIAKARLDEEY